MRVGMATTEQGSAREGQLVDLQHLILVDKPERLE